MAHRRFLGEQISNSGYVGAMPTLDFLTL